MTVEIPWGPIGYPTYKRTYARRLKESDPNSSTEEFEQSIDRIIVACDKQLKVGFTKREEKRLKNYFMDLKGSVAGRFWWQLGTRTVNQLGLLSLQNCAFTTVNDPIRPFTWAMDCLMLGSGVGYNIQREYVYELPKPKKVKILRKDVNDADFIVPDSREGWVKLLQKVLEAHFYTGKGFSYSTVCIRGKGSTISGFGGLASGPDELCWGMTEINNVLNSRAGKKIRPIDAMDMMNIIGQVVVAGNVRRSAQISIGDMDDFQFLNAKRWDLGNIPNWRAMSNNSIVCNDFSQLPDQFWEGYNGNGEPYGLINLKLAQSCGRIGDTEYEDPDVLGFNPCVTGDTEILTDNGYKRIDSLLDDKANIWNGFEWSEVQPKITGYNQKILKVKFSDGRELKCTPSHKFHLAVGYHGETKIVEAQDLKLNDKLIKHEFPIIDKGEEYNLDEMYTQGFYAADGNKNSKTIWLYGEKEKLSEYLVGKKGNSRSINQFGTERIDFYMSFESRSKEYVPLEGNLNSRLAWLSGLLDGDGCELNEGGFQIASINNDFLLNVQKLLSICSINSKIVKMSKAGKRLLPDGKGGYKYYHCQEANRICVGAKDVQNLIMLGLNTKRLKFNKVPNRDASRFNQVISIEEYGKVEQVYCFTEHKRNLGCFAGIITGQCAEQSLAPYETCCLAELFLPNIETNAELEDITKYLYRINKHSLALKCHHAETEAIVHKNMRMGIGVTGYLQATKKQRSWLSDNYEALREYDKFYSKKHGYPESIKLTTVKPSGTLSLLAGVTPGCHPAFSRYYKRRIRMASNIPLVETCRQNGYHVEFQKNFDGSEDKNTVVVEFPCSHSTNTTIAKDMKAIEQLEIVKELQTNWSDNAVSCTVYYRKSEIPQIKKWLSKNYNDNIKTCSFMLHKDHGFDQAPMEEISKDEFDKLTKQCNPITKIEKIDEQSILDSFECDGGVCPVK